MATPQTDDDKVLAHFRQMPETKLTKELIIPLLQCMGATHVDYLHGSSEKGKDIIFLKQDMFKQKLVACQVKNDKFTGKASSPSNTTAVLNQLLQCRNTHILHPVTHQKQLPNEVVLITTFPVPDKDTAEYAPIVAATICAGAA
jgi:hypothetical protein